MGSSGKSFSTDTAIGEHWRMSDFTSLTTSSQMFEIDKDAMKSYGLQAVELMESAGAVSAKEILSHKVSVMVLCGPGNNGGDGLVTARHLISKGINTFVFCSKKLSSPLSVQQKKQLSSPSYFLDDLNQMKKISNEVFIIVDALFGIGLCRNIEGHYKKIIHWINSLNKLVISLDIPSGLNADTGQIQGSAVKASQTFTFGLAKPGFYLEQGPVHTGLLKIFPIGFPSALLKKKANTHFLISEKWVSSQLPQRKVNDNKSHQGHLLVLAGRKGFWGAGQLCSLSAYRMGVGYVTLANSMNPLPSVPEALTARLSDKNLFLNKTAVAIGPGLGTDESVKKLILNLKRQKLPVVVDADAITVCIREDLLPLPSNWVITPHSGELGRLFSIKGKDIDQDRCFYAMEASKKVGCFVLLKGFHSVLADQKKCFIIPTGNSSLAKAGTGDVLTGFIGALLARGLSAFSATAVATFIHGKIADEWVESGKDHDTLMAQDLKELLPYTLKSLRKISTLKENC